MENYSIHLLVPPVGDPAPRGITATNLNNPPGAPPRTNREISGNRRHWIRRSVTRPARGVGKWQSNRDMAMVIHITASSWTFYRGHLAAPYTQKHQAQYVSYSLSLCPRSFLCSGLFWSGLLPPCLLPSFFYHSFGLPSPGGVTVLFSVVIPPFIRSSLLFLSLLLPCPGGWWWYCSLLSPVPSGDFPCLTCLSFFVLSSGWFCSVLCPSFRLSFFPFLSFSLSFSLFPYLFLSSRGGWLVTVLFLLCRRLSFFPLSFVFSSFVLPREWW